MSGADQTRLLTGERQDLMEDSVEQVRAGVGLYDKDICTTKYSVSRLM